MRMRTATVSTILAFVMVDAVYAETRPDFTGQWVLNKAKSKQRDPRQFKRQTLEVLQHDPDLEVDIRDEQPDGQEFRAYLKLRTDGAPTVAILGSPQRAVIRWKGDRMVICWNLDASAQSVSNGSGRHAANPRFTWTWTLSPNGVTLINEIYVYGDVTGDIVERWVFDRVRGGSQP